MRRSGKLTVIGWRELVSLPGLGIARLRAKVDTGAKTSSLHAEEVEEFDRSGEAWVRFLVRTRKSEFRCEAPVHERRQVRSSSGHAEDRYVIVAECEYGEVRWPIELTLTDRTPMRFPMLLGRQALSGRFVVDVSRSYLGGRRGKKAPPRGTA